MQPESLTIALLTADDGSVQWCWFDPEGVAWMGSAETENEAILAAANAQDEFFRHVH